MGPASLLARARAAVAVTCPAGHQRRKAAGCLVRPDACPPLSYTAPLCLSPDVRDVSTAGPSKTSLEGSLVFAGVS